jgi:hypothetical protein
VEQIYLTGFTNSSTPWDELVPLARSWLQAPGITLLNSFPAFVYPYDAAQKAYMIDYEMATEPGAALFEFAASEDSPLVNPTLLINNWGSTNPVLELNGQVVPQGSDFRFGFYNTLSDIDDGRTWQSVLVVWLQTSATEPTQIRIWPEGYDPSPVVQPEISRDFRIVKSGVKGRDISLTLCMRTGSEVKLSMLDIKGQEVGVIKNGYVPEGTHEILWKTPDQFKGVYLYKLDAGGVSHTGRLMFLND